MNVMTNGVWNAAEYLKRCHPRVLMQYRDKCCKFNGYYDVLGDNSPCVVSIDLVKAELATREHVPNKLEAKMIRREKARRK